MFRQQILNLFLKMQFLFKIRAKNLFFSTAGMPRLFILTSGLACKPLLWQKWTQRVFKCENLKQFSLAKFSILFKLSCNWPSLVFMLSDLKLIRKQSPYRDLSMLGESVRIMQFILRLNNVTDNVLPLDTPVSCARLSERVESILTLKFWPLRKFLIKTGKLPLISASRESFKMLYIHVVSYALSMLLL